MEMTETVQRECQEVYDNPNYSHIMIGGQPFFILPTGELSEHVPVPQQHLSVTPRKITVDTQLSGTLPPNNHIYEGGSSTYRSTSDYDTDSSNFRQESTSDSFHPIYEEIDKPSTNRSHHLKSRKVPGQESHPNLQSRSPPGQEFHPRLQPPGSRSPPECLPRFSSPESRTSSPGHSWYQQSAALSPRTRSGFSPRSINSSEGVKPGSSSIYYYSDTLKKKGLSDLDYDDSGVSSR